MRKLIWLFTVIVFAFLAGVVPASAQGVGIWGSGYRPSSLDGWRYYFQGDQVHMLQADMVNWVGETMRIGQRANARYVAENLVQNGPYIGLNGPRGFYPLYQCGKGQRIGRYAVDIGIGALLGAIIGGKKGAAIGGGLGTAVAVREDLKCWTVQNKMVVIDDPSDLAGGGDDGSGSDVPMPQSGRENGWNQRLRNQALESNSWFGSQPSCLDQGMFTLRNESGEAILVFKDGQPFAVLRPRQSKCGDPFAAYDAEIVSAVTNGYTATAGLARAKPEGRSGGVWVWR